MMRSLVVGYFADGTMLLMYRVRKVHRNCLLLFKGSREIRGGVDLLICRVVVRMFCCFRSFCRGSEEGGEGREGRR